MNEQEKIRGVGLTEGRDLKRYIDYEIVDSRNDKVGSLDCLWSDHNGEPAFLGVKTGWVFGKTHVVPAHEAEVNETTRIIRLPFTKETIKDAPAYEADLTMDEATEREIYGYYRLGTTEKLEEKARFSTGLEKEASAPLAEESTRIQLHEEELKIGKKSVDAGGVRLRKIIRTETVNQAVELEREEVVIERVPVSEVREGAMEKGTFEAKEIFIPLRREEAVVSKEDHVREEVRARKATKMEKQQISETLRKEDVKVEREGLREEVKREV